MMILNALLLGTLAVVLGVQSEMQLAVDYIIRLATNYIYLQVDNTQTTTQQQKHNLHTRSYA